MKRKIGLVLIATVSALAVGGCSLEGLQTGTTVGEVEVGNGRTSDSEFRRGVESLASGYFGLALQRFRAALDMNPQSARVMNALAVTYDRVGRHDLAQLYYDRALAIEPSSAATLNNLGYSLLTQDRYEEALIYFEQALKQRQEPADRRMTTANRQMALDSLRVARQEQERRGIVKAALKAPAAPGQADCRKQASSAVGRISDRVFMLITAPRQADSLPFYASRGTGVSGADSRYFDRDCQGGERKYVAVLTTVPAKKHGVAVGSGGSATAVETKQAAEAPAPQISAENEAQPAQAATKTAFGAAPDMHSQTQRIEVSNGAGRNKLAARMRAYLESKGFKVSYLTNAASFDNRRTTIFYKNGMRAAAERYAKQLPIPVDLVQVDYSFADIRIRLGSDILEFDRKTLYAATTGERNV